MIAEVVTSAASRMLQSSQKPARVPKDLRSSTVTMRASGIARIAPGIASRVVEAPARGDVPSRSRGGVVVVVMLLLLSGW